MADHDRRVGHQRGEDASMIGAHQAVGRPAPLGPAHVRARLGLDDSYRQWVQELAAVGPPGRPVRLPGARQAAGRLRRLACPAPDAAAAAACLPSPERTPVLWWLLERCAQRLLGDLGGIDYFVCRWPSLPASLGPAGRLFYAHVFLAVLDDVRAWQRARGIPDDVAMATLSDLGRRMALYRSVHGEPGLAAQDWLTLHLRGALYQLGRLQFHRSRIVPGLIGAGPLFWYDRRAAHGMGPGYRHGDPVLGIHIPATGPLTPDACDHSLRWAGEFFERTFASERYRLAVCTSWLLDEQLAGYLPATSNIVRFQRRFRLVPGTLDDDAGVLGSVFGRLGPSLDDLSPRTTLERAVVAQLRAGRHWRIRTGWFEL
jgi:hypothetical protein